MVNFVIGLMIGMVVVAAFDDAAKKHDENIKKGPPQKSNKEGGDKE